MRDQSKRKGLDVASSNIYLMSQDVAPQDAQQGVQELRVKLPGPSFLIGQQPTIYLCKAMTVYHNSYCRCCCFLISF